MEHWLGDLRQALLSLLWRRRAFALLTILVMALGLGSATAMFSVVHGLLLRPLALPQPERLVDVGWRWQEWRVGMDDAQFRAFAQAASGYSAIAARTRASYTLSTGTGSERLSALHVSAGYFDLLGVAPRIGQGIGLEEDRAGASAVVVIGEGLRDKLFGAEDEVLGRQVYLDGRAHALLGVLPATYADSPGVDLYLPLAPVATGIGQGSNYQVLGRLAPGYSQAAAEEAFSTLVKEQWPGMAQSAARPELLPYAQSLVQTIRAPLAMLSAAIGLVLLIACANVANLLTLRAVDRGRELALRSVLGAGTLRIQRLLLAESLVIALLGCLLGLLIAHGLVEWLLHLRPEGLPRIEEVAVDLRAWGFSLLLALLLGVLAALPAMWQARRTDPGIQLKAGSNGSLHAAGGSLRGALVVGQVALALVLSVAAGLLAQTFERLHGVDPGFDPHGRVAAQFWTTGTRHRSSRDVAALAAALRERAERLPGVRAAAVVAAGLPLERGGNFGVSVSGEDPDGFRSTDFRAISQGFFATLGAPLLQGRDFDTRDEVSGQRVAIVSEAFVRQRLPDQEPLGRLLHAADASWEIIGVARDLRSLVGEEPPATVYLPLAQTPIETLRIFEGWFPMQLVLAGGGAEGALVEAATRILREVDAELPVGSALPMAHVHARAIGEPRFRSLLMSGFAGFALLLAVIGIYAVLSHLFGRRVREIGIELALGAHPLQLTGRLLHKGLRPALLGLGVGLLAAIYLSRFLEGFLFGVQPLSATVYLGVVAVLAVAALFAGLLPALRATRMAPMQALRQE